MSVTLTLLLVFAARAFAVENIDCELALTPPRETTVVPGYALRLEPGQVLFRGTLEMLFSRTSERTFYSVRDEMGAQKVFSHPLKAVFPLVPDDQIFFLDAVRRKVRAVAYYGEEIDERVVRVGGRDQILRPNRPLFLNRPGERISRLSRQQAQDVFQQKVPVVVVRNLNPEGYESLRERVMPEIRAYEANLNDPRRFYPVTAAETCELAHYERAHSGTLKWKMIPRLRARLDLGGGKFRPEKRIYEVALDLRKPGGEVISAAQGDLIYLIDEADHVLLKYEQGRPRIEVYEPYETQERQLCEVLAFAKRVVIVRPTEL